MEQVMTKTSPRRHEPQVWQGRRAPTLRKHAKTWMKVRNWMKSTFFKPWPENAEEFALFLGVPCK